MQQRQIILGASGFLGSHLYESLRQQGKTVIGVSRSVPPKYSSTGHEYHASDLLAPDCNLDFLEKGDVVFVTLSALLPRDNASLETFSKDTFPNYIGLLEKIYKKFPQKVVYLSTGTIYGNCEEASLKQAPAPTSLYGVFKSCVENFLRMLSSKHSVSTHILRLANPYGPRLLPGQRLGLVETLLKSAADDRKIKIPSREIVRDFIFIEDVIEQFRKAVIGEENFSVYNIGTGVGSSARQVKELVEEVTGSTFEEGVFLPNPDELERITLAPSFETKTCLKEGIRLSWESFKQTAP